MRACPQNRMGRTPEPVQRQLSEAGNLDPGLRQPRAPCAPLENPHTPEPSYAAQAAACSNTRTNSSGLADPRTTADLPDSDEKMNTGIDEIPSALDAANA